MVIAPWTVRNYMQLGKLIYIRGGLMLEVWLGVCPEADAHGAAVYTTRFPLFNEYEAAEVARLGEAGYIEARGRQAVDAIRDDPLRVLRLCALRAADYWAGTMFTHTTPGGSPWPTSLTRAGLTLFLSAEVLVIGAWILSRRRIGADLRWLLAVVVVFSIVYCLTHVMVRFRAPVEPIMAVLVAASVMDFVRTRRVAPGSRL